MNTNVSVSVSSNRNEYLNVIYNDILCISILCNNSYRYTPFRTISPRNLPAPFTIHCPISITDTILLGFPLSYLLEGSVCHIDQPTNSATRRDTQLATHKNMNKHKKSRECPNITCYEPPYINNT